MTLFRCPYDAHVCRKMHEEQIAAPDKVEFEVEFTNKELVTCVECITKAKRELMAVIRKHDIHLKEILNQFAYV